MSQQLCKSVAESGCKSMTVGLAPVGTSGENPWHCICYKAGDWNPFSQSSILKTQRCCLYIDRPLVKGGNLNYSRNTYRNRRVREMVSHSSMISVESRCYQDAFDSHIWLVCKCHSHKTAKPIIQTNFQERKLSLMWGQSKKLWEMKWITRHKLFCTPNRNLVMCWHKLAERGMEAKTRNHIMLQSHD